MTTVVAAIPILILLLLAGAPTLLALTDRSQGRPIHRSANIDRTLRTERAAQTWRNAELSGARPHFHQP